MRHPNSRSDVVHEDVIHREKPESWSDDEVLAAARAMMSTAEDERLSELLDHQQAGLLTDGERPELETLMRVYAVGTPRMALGLREAIRRGWPVQLRP
jgi:hypothetical protein